MKIIEAVIFLTIYFTINTSTMADENSKVPSSKYTQWGATTRVGATVGGKGGSAEVGTKDGKFEANLTGELPGTKHNVSIDSDEVKFSHTAEGKNLSIGTVCNSDKSRCTDTKGIQLPFGIYENTRSTERSYNNSAYKDDKGVYHPESPTSSESFENATNVVPENKYNNPIKQPILETKDSTKHGVDIPLGVLNIEASHKETYQKDVTSAAEERLYREEPNLRPAKSNQVVSSETTVGTNAKLGKNAKGDISVKGDSSLTFNEKYLDRDGNELSHDSERYDNKVNQYLSDHLDGKALSSHDDGEYRVRDRSFDNGLEAVIKDKKTQTDVGFKLNVNGNNTEVESPDETAAKIINDAAYNENTTPEETQKRQMLLKLRVEKFREMNDQNEAAEKEAQARAEDERRAKLSESEKAAEIQSEIDTMIVLGIASAAISEANSIKSRAKDQSVNTRSNFNNGQKEESNQTTLPVKTIHQSCDCLPGRCCQ